MSGGEVGIAREGDDHPARPPPTSPQRRSLSLLHLTALAIACVLAVSGMVPAADLFFFPFSILYLHLLSSVAFPRLRPAPDPPVFGRRNRHLAAYGLAAAVVGLLLPVAHILDGVLAGDREGVEAGAPHLFLHCAQIFHEGAAYVGRFSLPAFACVPVFYNTKRLFTIFDWVASEVGKGEGGEHGAARRVLAGRALAVANLVFWTFNLFGFLLPVFVPRVMKSYYCEYNNINSNNKAKD